MENKIKSQSLWKTSPNFTSMSQCRQRHNSVSGLSSQDKIADNTRLSTYKTPPITFTIITAQKECQETEVARQQLCHKNGNNKIVLCAPSESSLDVLRPLPRRACSDASATFLASPWPGINAVNWYWIPCMYLVLAPMQYNWHWCI